MTYIEDDRSRTVCDHPGCDAVKPSWSTYGGTGAIGWFEVATRLGAVSLDFCCRDHAAAHFAPTITQGEPT